MSTIGILAYGSLILTPDVEIEVARVNTIDDISTPFCIEFARSSTGRGGAPTLVPVLEGGAQVKGKVFVMDLSEKDATDILYRREINKVQSNRQYQRPKLVKPNSVLVERLEGFAGLDVVLYTKIAANIDPLTAQHLADLAIASVGKSCPERDGVSYLINAKTNGISTGLSTEYEAEILKKTHCDSLSRALKKLMLTTAKAQTS